jgi:hypothetical protein
LELNSKLSEKVSNKLQAGYTPFDFEILCSAPVINIQDGFAGANYVLLVMSRSLQIIH